MKTGTKSRRRPLQERAKFTVEAILVAARELYERDGFEHTTTNHIARRAGVSIGSLYQYFPDKNAILSTLLEHHLGEVEAIFEFTTQGGSDDRGSAPCPLKEGIDTIVSALLKLHMAHPTVHQLLLTAAHISPTTEQRAHAIEERIRAGLVRWFERLPEVDLCHADHAAWLTLHVAESLTHEYVVHPSGMERTLFVGEVSRMIQMYITLECGQPM